MILNNGIMHLNSIHFFSNIFISIKYIFLVVFLFFFHFVRIGCNGRAVFAMCRYIATLPENVFTYTRRLGLCDVMARSYFSFLLPKYPGRSIVCV